MLTQIELKRLLKYDPDIGVFYWINQRRGRPKSNNEAGNTCKINGYVRITLNGVQHKAHKLAFLYMDGHYPDIVDHINRHRSDNRWCNLRACSIQQNNFNTSKKSTNTSGHPGVYWQQTRNKWRVIVGKNGRQHSFGYHEDYELAALVADEAKVKLFGNYAPTAQRI